MALPQGIRWRGPRPRDCTCIDGSENFHRVNRIHSAPRARTSWCAHATWGAEPPAGDQQARPGVAAVVSSVTDNTGIQLKIMQFASDGRSQ
eukprot:2088562-Prymnesium_polylepis.1